jgi:hypothetical protein
MAIPLFVVNDERRRVITRRKVLEDYSDSDIRKVCGVDWRSVREIINIFEPLEGTRRSAVPLETKVITFLHYLRSGTFQWSLASSSGTSQATVSDNITQCTDRLLNIAPNIIDFATDPDSITARKQGFFDVYRPKGFPNILGVLDGTHIGIIAPNEDEDKFVNRKNYHSINCQVVTDPSHRFLDINAKFPGSSHDSFIWRQSSVRTRLSEGRLGGGWFLGKIRSFHYKKMSRITDCYVNQML